jgi:hypothetical protein
MAQLTLKQRQVRVHQCQSVTVKIGVLRGCSCSAHRCSHVCQPGGLGLYYRPTSVCMVISLQVRPA